MNYEQELAICEAAYCMVPEHLPSMDENQEQFLNSAACHYPAALRKLIAIEELARKHNHPGVNIADHGLAGDILKVLGE